MYHKYADEGNTTRRQDILLNHAVLPEAAGRGRQKMGEHEGHRSRMKRRFLRHGLSSFDDHNILELLLFYAQPRKDTNPIAHRLMETFGSLEAVFEAPPEALMRVEGVGESAAVLIHLVPEAARRYRIAKETPGTILTSSREAGQYLIPRFLNAREESVYLLCLDPKNRVLDCRRLCDGSPTAVLLSVRQIVEAALAQNAASVILAHNHPNGLAIPSQEDIAATRRVRDALELMNITLLDHIIVAGEDFVSMSDSRLVV